MRGKCSVPGCISNYRYPDVPDSPHIPVIKLPTGPPGHVHIWLRAINSENISDIKNIFACVKHFCEEGIIRKFKTLKPDGTYTNLPQKKCRLSDDAVPYKFPNCPSYLFSTQPKPVRFSCDENMLDYLLR